jgi:hypothetical protein
MPIRLHGFDQVSRKLRDLQRRAEKLDGLHGVKFDELFPPSFMRRYSDFETIGAMVDASGFRVESADDFARIPDDEWDRFVASRTRFANWREMQDKAAAEWTGKRLGF